MTSTPTDAELREAVKRCQDFSNEDCPECCLMHQWTLNMEALGTLMDYVRAVQAPRLTGHSDDLAVDEFAAAMKIKLAQKRAEGRSGWDDPDECHIDFLVSLLHGHIQKGDPIDIANIAMMLWSRGLRGNASVPAPRLTEDEFVRWCGNCACGKDEAACDSTATGHDDFDGVKCSGWSPRLTDEQVSLLCRVQSEMRGLGMLSDVANDLADEICAAFPGVGEEG